MTELFRARYLDLEQQGELGKREQILTEMLESCCLCARNCRVNRLAGQTGVCGTGAQAEVASCASHFCEEARRMELQSRAAIERLGQDERLLSDWHNHVSLNRIWAKEYDQALMHIEKAHQISLTLYGPEHPRIASDYNNVGVVHLERVLGICQKVICAKRKTAENMFSAADLIREYRQAQHQAMRLAQAALKIFRKLPDESKKVQEVEAWLQRGSLGSSHAAKTQL